MKKLLIILAAIAAFVLIGAPSAYATGSDSPTPYSVTEEGVTLPEGVVFQNNGHINIKYVPGGGTEQAAGIHFEALNWPEDHPKKFYIGKSFIPWSAFGLESDFCVSWVQIHGFNEHFGEGKQEPVCVNPPVECKNQEVPDPVKCAIPPKPESWITEQERTNNPECVVPANGSAIVTVEKSVGTKEFTWNPDTWEWVLPLEYTWSDWEVVDTQYVMLPECDVLPPTGAGLNMTAAIAGGALLLGGAAVVVMSSRRKAQQ